MSNPEPKSTSITTKISHLNQAIEWFYGDDFSLDQAVKHYQSAAKLATEIEQDLNNLKNQITVIDQDFTKSSSTS